MSGTSLAFPSTVGGHASAPVSATQKTSGGWLLNTICFFSSRRRHTRCLSGLEFRRVLFRSQNGEGWGTLTSTAGQGRGARLALAQFPPCMPKPPGATCTYTRLTAVRIRYRIQCVSPGLASDAVLHSVPGSPSKSHSDPTQNVLRGLLRRMDIPVRLAGGRSAEQDDTISNQR